MLAYLFPITAAFLWSTNFIVARAMAGQVPPWTLAAGRFTTAALIMLPLIVLRGSRPSRRDLWLLLLAAIPGVTLWNSLGYWAIQYTTATNATLVNALYPLSAILVSRLILGEPLTARRNAAVLLSLSGVALIMARGTLQNLLSLDLNPGDLVYLLNTFLWAGYSVTCRLVVGRVGALETSAWTLLLGAPLIWPGAGYEISRIGSDFLTPKTVGVFIYLGFFTSVLAFWLWTIGVQRLGPARSSLMYNAIPFFAAILAWLILGESIAWYHLAGGALIISGAYLGSAPAATLPRQPSPPATADNSSVGQTNS